MAQLSTRTDVQWCVICENSNETSLELLGGRCIGRNTDPRNFRLYKTSYTSYSSTEFGYVYGSLLRRLIVNLFPHSLNVSPHLRDGPDPLEPYPLSPDQHTAQLCITDNLHTCVSPGSPTRVIPKRFKG